MKFLVSLFSAIFLACSFQAVAAKITITGEPVTLIKNGNVYSLPKTYTPTATGYYYVNLDGSKSVCYLESQESQPALASITSTNINVEVDGKTVAWYCYPFDETYFEVTP